MFNHGAELKSFPISGGNLSNGPQRIFLDNFLTDFFKTFYCGRYLIWSRVKSHVNWIIWKKQGTPYTQSKKSRSEQQNPVLVRLTHIYTSQIINIVSLVTSVLTINFYWGKLLFHIHEDLIIRSLERSPQTEPFLFRRWKVKAGFSTQKLLLLRWAFYY